MPLGALNFPSPVPSVPNFNEKVSSAIAISDETKLPKNNKTPKDKHTAIFELM